MIWVMRLIGVALIALGFSVGSQSDTSNAGNVIGLIGCVWIAVFLFVGGRRP